MSLFSTRTGRLGRCAQPAEDVADTPPVSSGTSSIMVDRQAEELPSP
jgi:hypothetical protein